MNVKICEPVRCCVVIVLQMGFYYRLPTLSPAPEIGVWCVCVPPCEFPVEVFFF